MKILVVDDESGFRQMLTEWLRRRGYDVDALTDESNVLTILSRRTYDVVVLDLIMPRANGPAILSEIRRLFPEIRVIVVSASVDVRVAIELARAGAEACFDKPVDFSALEDYLKRVQMTVNPPRSTIGLSLLCES